MDMNFTLENVASLHNFTTWETQMEKWHRFSFMGVSATAVAERLGIMDLLTVTDGQFTARMTETHRVYNQSTGRPSVIKWEFLFEDEADAVAFRMWLNGARK